MAVPAGKTDDAPIRRRSARTDTGCPACRVSRETPPDQIRDGNVIAVTLRLNIIGRGGCGCGVSENFLLKIADGDVERAPGDEIGGCVVRARLGKLPVSGSAGQVRESQRSSKHDKGENNDQRSAFRCAIMRTKELFHGVTTFIGLEGYWKT